MDVATTLAPRPPAAAEMQATSTTAPPTSATSFAQSAAGGSTVLLAGQVGDLLLRHSQTVIDKLHLSEVDPSSVESNSVAPGGSVEISSKLSKPAWRKFVADNREPLPVMGAVSWPALGEAPAGKSSELCKPISSSALIRKGGPKPPPAPIERESLTIQSSTSERSSPSWAGEAGFEMPPVTSGMTGSSTSLSRAVGRTENLSASYHGLYPSDRSVTVDGETKTKDAKGSATSINSGRALHHKGKGGATPFNSKNEGYRRKSMWARGKWNHYWRTNSSIHADGRDSGFAMQQQQVGPRNLPPPMYSFTGIDPAFIHAAELFNAGSDVYLVPATAPDLLHCNAYYMPFGPPGGPVNGPDPKALRSMLANQIEYYFSIENLCSDLYLRSHMDYQGFVHVSLIASFNRVRTLTCEPNVILEALCKSTVVEVQGSRIRRRGDWERWVLGHQESASGNSEGNCQDIYSRNPGDDCEKIFKSSSTMRKAENGHSLLDRHDGLSAEFLTSSVPLSEKKAEQDSWEERCASGFPEDSSANTSEGRDSVDAGI